MCLVCMQTSRTTRRLPVEMQSCQSCNPCRVHTAVLPYEMDLWHCSMLSALKEQPCQNTL